MLLVDIAVTTIDLRFQGLHEANPVYAIIVDNVWLQIVFKTGCFALVFWLTRKRYLPNWFILACIAFYGLLDIKDIYLGLTHCGVQLWALGV